MGDKPGHAFHGNQWTEGHQSALTQHLTREDRKRFERETARGGRGNPYAIALELQAADQMKMEIDKGKDPSKAFSDNFTATASNHRVAKKLGLNLDVDRGDWVEKGAKEAEKATRRAEFHARTGTLDFTKEEEKASKMTDAELAFARKDAFKAAEAMGRENPKQGFYMDQASVYAREQSKRGVSAAKNAEKDAEAIKTRIRSQLGVTPEQHAEMQAEKWFAAGGQGPRSAEALKAHGAPDLVHLAKESAIPANAAAISHAPLTGIPQADRNEIIGTNRKVYGARAGKEVTGKLVQGEDGYWRETKASRSKKRG